MDSSDESDWEAVNISLPTEEAPQNHVLLLSVENDSGHEITPEVAGHIGEFSVGLDLRTLKRLKTGKAIQNSALKLIMPKIAGFHDADEVKQLPDTAHKIDRLRSILAEDSPEEPETQLHRILEELLSPHFAAPKRLTRPQADDLAFEVGLRELPDEILNLMEYDSRSSVQNEEFLTIAKIPKSESYGDLTPNTRLDVKGKLGKSSSFNPKRPSILGKKKFVATSDVLPRALSYSGSFHMNDPRVPQDPTSLKKMPTALVKQGSFRHTEKADILEKRKNPRTPLNVDDSILYSLIDLHSPAAEKKTYSINMRNFRQRTRSNSIPVSIEEIQEIVRKGSTVISESSNKPSKLGKGSSGTWKTVHGISDVEIPRYMSLMSYDDDVKTDELADFAQSLFPYDLDGELEPLNLIGDADQDNSTLMSSPVGSLPSSRTSVTAEGSQEDEKDAAAVAEVDKKLEEQKYVSIVEFLQEPPSPVGGEAREDAGYLSKIRSLRWWDISIAEASDLDRKVFGLGSEEVGSYVSGFNRGGDVTPRGMRRIATVGNIQDDMAIEEDSHRKALRQKNYSVPIWSPPNPLEIDDGNVSDLDERLNSALGAGFKYKGKNPKKAMRHSQSMSQVNKSPGYGDPLDELRHTRTSTQDLSLELGQAGGKSRIFRKMSTIFKPKK